MLVYCFYSFLLQDLFLSLQVFAFKGQNMTFTVNVLLTRILLVAQGPAMICESIAAQFLTFVPHGELQGKGTDRLGILQPALATSSPFSAAQQKCFRLLSIQFKISTLCFKTTTQSATVRRCPSFGFLPLFEAGFSVLFDSFNFSLLRKGHDQHFAVKQECSSFPNHH